MANNPSLFVPATTEERRAAAAQFERAQQIIAAGNPDYGIQLLLGCCKLDPANIIFRQALRRAGKNKYSYNMRGSRLRWLTSMLARARFRVARRARAWLRALEHGEEILTRNPWDTEVQLDLADAADQLGLIDLAVWFLEQARQKDTKHLRINRTLARLYEKRGNFAQASALWDLVRQADPADVEASHKARDLENADTYVEPTDVLPSRDEARTWEASASLGIADLEARVEKDPTSAEEWLELAAYYRRAGQLDQARGVLQQGRGPTGNDFRITLALTELELEPFRHDLALTEEKLRATPADSGLRRIRARLQKEVLTRELDVWRLKADRYPAERMHRLEIGIRLLRLGQHDEAIRELQNAREDAHTAAHALLYIGHCHLERKNWKLARQHWEEALRLLPGTAEERKHILQRLAHGCAANSELPQAIDWARELVLLDPEYRNASRMLEELQSRRRERMPARS